MAFTFQFEDATHEVTIARRQPALVLTVDGVQHAVAEAGSLTGDEVLMTIDGRSYAVWRVIEGDRIHLHIGGRSFSVAYADPISAAHQQAGGDDTLRADMPGVVVAVNGEAGASVAPGDVLLVIESMKMQINIVAHRAGRIETLHVEVNQSFDKGAPLISLHAES
jgi:acetyl/propionyl-CoA carboxylase alpha subunit